MFYCEGTRDKNRDYVTYFVCLLVLRSSEYNFG